MQHQQHIEIASVIIYRAYCIRIMDLIYNNNNDNNNNRTMQHITQQDNIIICAVFVNKIGSVTCQGSDIILQEIVVILAITKTRQFSNQS